MNYPRKGSKLLTLREKYKDSGMQEQCIWEVNTGTLCWLRKPLFFPYRKCVTCALFRNFLHIISGRPLKQNFVKKMHIPSLIQRLTLLVCLFFLMLTFRGEERYLFIVWFSLILHFPSKHMQDLQHKILQIYLANLNPWERETKKTNSSS